MSLVVDTNVLVYHFLETKPYCERTTRLFEREAEIIAPDLWRPEYLNVIWRSVLSGDIEIDVANQSFLFAERLVQKTIPTSALWGTALRIALDSNVSAYDALYVALAERERTFLATYDQRMLHVFPASAKRPEEIPEDL